MTSTSDQADYPDLPVSPPAQPDPIRRTIFSVSELTERIKNLIETNFPLVWVRGEVSNFRTPGSGHHYFTLKDARAQIAAVMFRGQNRQARFVPEDGMSVVGLGRLSVYEPRGTYQLILEYIEPAGIGALQVAFEKLKRRLSEEGFFDKRHKKPIPFLPARVSVITSPSGSVVHDIVTIMSRRFPNIPIEILPAKVQGPGAESEIVSALRLANSRRRSDVIILARGGGSLEDLQAFNSEAVAMAIFESAIPVISAVGHETDITIADFIADLRAPTPSAAAELVVPEKAALVRRCRDLDAALRSRAAARIAALKSGLENIRRRLADPRRRVQELWLRMDDLSGRFTRAVSGTLGRQKDRHAFLLRRLSANSPRALVDKHNTKLDVLNHNLLKNIKIIIDKKRNRLREFNIRLESLNPLAILQRGYSITRSLPDKRVVTDPDQVYVEQAVEILVAGGQIECRVKGKSRHGQENI